ncbi:MAG: hypothetical protein FJ278_23430, partial [Planctomycetes bacterium]|nr:hypothetical protein [Planctomycetota bacterium]
MSDQDRTVVRDLAKQVAEISQMAKQNVRRDLWRKHNSLVKTRPPVLVSAGASWPEVCPDSELKCKDGFLRHVEVRLRQVVFQDSLDDDHIVEPWFTVGAAFVGKLGDFRWGPQIKRTPRGAPGGTWQFDPPIRKEEDLAQLVKPHHVINEQVTAANAAKVREAIGDILEVDVDRGPAYRSFTADLSYDSANLRGLEQVMLDMVERPEWLHKLMRFLSEGVLTCHDEADATGDWHLTSGGNQAMCYSLDLPDPKPNTAATRKQLWCFAAAQEYAWVGPKMHDEFLLRYQMPIMKEFGLVAYGCCEDLTKKLDMLKQIPNLRRIAITPQADVRASA